MSKLYIAFQGGTHGHFLRYFLDKYCSTTPDLPELPFDSVGASHKILKYSTKFDRYHPTVEGFKDISAPHCVITVSKEDLLFLQRIVYIRPGNINTNLKKSYITFPKQYFKSFGFKDTDTLNNLYKIKINEQTLIPNFILRDFLKLGFNDPNNHGYIINNKKLLKNNLKNVHYLPVDCFWNKQKFFQQINILNKKFDLSLSFPHQEEDYIYNEFIKNIEQFPTKDRCKNILQALKDKKSLDISDIDVVEQAYLYAKLEETNNFITMPLSESFFKNTDEIMEYIKYYPEHYKAMNPNLPIFNNIPNPFFLHRQETK